MANDDDGARELERFIGAWEVEFEMPGVPPAGGTTTFDWLLGRRFVAQRARADHPDAPEGYMVIAPDANRPGGWLQHYFDSRGVVRLYEMDLDGRDWTLTRTKPDFSPLDFAQRWVSRFGEDGDTIEGQWETSPDGQEWQLDFRLTYRRAGSGR